MIASLTRSVQRTADIATLINHHVTKGLSQQKVPDTTPCPPTLEKSILTSIGISSTSFDSSFRSISANTIVVLPASRLDNDKPIPVSIPAPCLPGT